MPVVSAQPVAVEKGMVFVVPFLVAADPLSFSAVEGFLVVLCLPFVVVFERYLSSYSRQIVQTFCLNLLKSNCVEKRSFSLVHVSKMQKFSIKIF